MRNLSKVLVVDDSASACLFMAQALEKAGYEVITAASGYEGLAKTVQERPQCLVLDVVLPGVSGFELCRRLRAMEHRLSIILVSTKNTLLDRNWGLRQGADRYLPKPFTEELLVQTVEEVLPERARPFIPAEPPRVEIQRSFARPQQPQPDRHKVIPYRIEDHLLTGSNPLNNSVVILDKRARHLYSAIDGHRNVQDLCAIMHCDIEELYGVLQILLTQRRIQLHRLQLPLTDNSSFLN